MPACPSCQRPIATTRASCLYCGAALPREPRAAAPTTVEPAAVRDPSRALVLIPLAGCDAELLAAALDPAVVGWIDLVAETEVAEKLLLEQGFHQLAIDDTFTLHHQPRVEE